jgi:dipeptide/tripeptide permease
MGKLHAISWDYVFYTAAATIGLMLVITLLFYKEPARDIEGVSLSKKFRDMKEALSDVKFLTFIILLGLFFWLPFWSFFNILAVYINDHLNTAGLYQTVKGVLGETVTSVISNQRDGVWRINPEAISHTGYIIILFQVLISRIFEKRPAIPSFLFGLSVATAGFIVLGLSATMSASLVFLGVFLFAVGEMTSSPRIQEYILWIAPKEKAGLYMGTSFLATAIGALLSGLYTGLLGVFEKGGNPQYIMYTLALHTILGIAAIWIFTRTMGEFKERSE